MAFGNYSENPMRNFATLDKNLYKKKTTRQKVEVLLNVIKMADT